MAGAVLARTKGNIMDFGNGFDKVDVVIDERINGRKLRVTSWRGDYVSVYTSVKGNWRSIVCFKALESLPRRGYARMAVAKVLFPKAAK